MGVQTSSKMSLSLSIPQDKILGRGICAEPGWARRRPEPIGKDWWVRSFCIREIPIGRISTRCSWFKRAQIVAVYHAISVFSASRRKPLEHSCAFGILPLKKGSFSLQFRPFLRSGISDWEKKIFSSFLVSWSSLDFLFILLREDCWHFCFRYFLFYRNTYV